MNNFLENYGAAFVDAFDDAYQNAKLGPKVVELSEGRYQFGVQEVKIIEKGNSQYPGLDADQYYDHMLVIQLRVLNDCAYKDCLTNKFHGICLANVKRIKGDLSAMGHEFEGLNKLVDDIEAGTMIGLIVDGRVTKKRGKTGKEYTNVWLDRCVGRMTPEEMGMSYHPEDDDDEMPWG